MLLQMRNFSRSWIAIGLLVILGGMFVFFLGDGTNILSALQVRDTNTLARVAGRAITPAQLTRELDLTLRAQRNEGRNLSQADAIEAGVHLRLLEALIGRAALGAYAEKVGISASDEQIAARIREIPAARNQVTDAFDEAAYQAFLRQLGYDHGEFVEDLRGEMNTQMVMEALASGVRTPSSFGALALAYESETRTVSIAEAPASVVGAIPVPNDAQIQTFYEESQEQLRVPEYRALTLVFARVSDFIPRVEVPEQRLREEFEARRAALTQPERRSYIRLSAPDQAQANSAAQRLGRGESPEAVAAALGLRLTRGENHTRAEVLDARVAEAVFSMPARSPPRVLQGQLASAQWVVVRVESVTAASAPNFAEQSAAIRQAIAADEAGEMLNAAVSAFEDMRASGTAAAEAANRNGLVVTQIAAIDAQGRGPDGAPAPQFAEQTDLLATVFETGEGEATDFTPLGDADVLVAVDRIIPSKVRPLAEVRALLAQQWSVRERARRLRELGAELAEAVRGGQNFAAAARARRFNVAVSSRPLNRPTAAQALPRGLAGQLFAAREGAVVTEVRADGGAIWAAVTERITRVDPTEAPQQVEANRGQLQESLTASFGEAVQAEIIASAKPQRNEALVAQIYPRANAEGETEPQQ